MHIVICALQHVAENYSLTLLVYEKPPFPEPQSA